MGLTIPIPLTGGPLLATPRKAPRPPIMKGYLTATDIAKVWVEEGGDPGKARFAAAIALAESSGNAKARSPNPSGGTNLGLFQVDSGSHKDATDDVRGNVRAAIRISKNGTDWGPWEVFHTGAYKKYLDAAGKRIGLPGSGIPGAVEGTADAVGGAVNTVKDVGAFVGKLSDYIFDPDWWRRVGLVMIGFALFVMGMAYFAKNFVAGQAGTLAKTVINAKK